ncbi:MAG: CPBP family intramembrane metalloprotease, partial [Streptococcus sanguinis]|nr:CPBP family intramembrane metalloprotease [Streptococcus sanguinis]
YRQAFKSVWFWVLVVFTFLGTFLPVMAAYIVSLINNS